MYTEKIISPYRDMGTVEPFPADYPYCPTELTGSGAMIAPYFSTSSASRNVMLTSHSSQAYVIDNPTAPRNMSGVEVELGKYTFKIEFENECRIIEVIPKYQKQIGRNAIHTNFPLTIIIENLKTYVLDYIELEQFYTRDITFGFKFDYNTTITDRIAEGAVFYEGDIIADSPSVCKQTGVRRSGRETLTAIIGAMYTIEDGFGALDTWLEKMSGTGCGSRSGSFGRNLVPRNLYGTIDNYKPFPDIGEAIRPDGLLMAFYELDPENDWLNLTPVGMMRIDRESDIILQAKPNAIVYDITVTHNSAQQVNCPWQMAEQARKYWENHQHYWKRLMTLYQRYYQQNGASLRMTGKLNRLITMAHGYCPEAIPGQWGDNLRKRRTKMVLKQAVRDEWNVEIKYHYKIKPTKGHKFSDNGGQKGEICYVYTKETAPITQDGRVVELVYSPVSVPKRTNLNQLYEMFISASGTALQAKLKNMYSSHAPIADMWEQCLTYFHEVSPITKAAYEEIGINDQMREELICHIIDNNTSVVSPADNPQIDLSVVKRCYEAGHAPLYAPISICRNDGTRVNTVLPVLVDTKMIYALEKIGSERSAVAVPKLQVHGLISKLTQADKYSSPGRKVAYRGVGESEDRHQEGFGDPEAAAETLDRGLNPISQRELYKSILNAENPSQIANCVDRNKFPRTGGRGFEIVKNLYYCQGTELCND